MEHDTPRSIGYGSPRDDRFYTPRSIGRENSSHSDEWQTPRYETPRYGEYNSPRAGSDNEFQTPRTYDPSLPNSARARGNSSSSIIASNYYHTHHQRNDSLNSQYDDAKGYPGYYSARSSNPSPRLSDSYHHNSEAKSSSARPNVEAKDNYYSSRLPQQVFEDKQTPFAPPYPSGRAIPTTFTAHNTSTINEDYEVDELAENVEAMGMTEQDVEALFSFARHGRSEEIEKLLQKGLPVDVRDNYGNTVLVIACQNGNKRVAKAVLRRGANINARNHKGNTPLHYCYHYGYGDSLGQYMIEKGADSNARNNAGKLAYQGI